MSDTVEATVQGESIKVRVLFFGAARDVAGSSELQLTVNSPATARSVFEQLLLRFPGLQRFGRSLLLAVNHEYAPVDLDVRDGDELALFPPVSGGARDNR